MRHVDHRQPTAWAQDTPEPLKNCHEIPLWKEIEHVSVYDNIESVIRERQVIRVADTKTVTLKTGSGCSSLCADQHRRSQIDAFVVTGRIGFKNLDESQTRSYGHLQNIFTVANIGQIQAAVPRMSFCQPSPYVVKWRDLAVDFGNLFLFDFGVQHRVDGLSQRPALGQKQSLYLRKLGGLETATSGRSSPGESRKKNPHDIDGD